MPLENKTSDLKNRAFYGSVIGAALGMIIGTMPGNDPRIAIISMGVSALLISALAALSNNFWESLCSVWELVRFSFWKL